MWLKNPSQLRYRTFQLRSPERARPRQPARATAVPPREEGRRGRSGAAVPQARPAGARRPGELLRPREGEPVAEGDGRGLDREPRRGGRR